MADELPKLSISLPGFTLDPQELEELRLQDEVWEDETEDFLDRLGVGPGTRVLDWGCGFGFDLPRLARRVGPTGEVVGVEPNPLLVAECRKLITRLGLKRTRVVLGDPGVEPVPDGNYDAVFCSWKPRAPQTPPAGADVRTLLKRARSLLSDDGRIGVFELHHEGLRLFPFSPAVDRVVQAISPKPALSYHLPGEFLSCGFMFESAWPRQKAEAPGTTTYRWMEKVLQEQAARLLKEEQLTENEWTSFQQECEQRRVDPKTLLFSPQAVGVVGRAIFNPLG